MLQSYNDKITQQKRAQTTNRLTCTDDPLLTCTDDPWTHFDATKINKALLKGPRNCSECHTMTWLTPWHDTFPEDLGCGIPFGAHSSNKIVALAKLSAASIKRLILPVCHLRFKKPALPSACKCGYLETSGNRLAAWNLCNPAWAPLLECDSQIHATIFHVSPKCLWKWAPKIAMFMGMMMVFISVVVFPWFFPINWKTTIIWKPPYTINQWMVLFQFQTQPEQRISGVASFGKLIQGSGHVDRVQFLRGWLG